jgi:transmembrane sensor
MIFSSPGKPLLIAVLIALASVIPAAQRPDPALATKAGEWRTFAFEDGTAVTLGPRTVLTYSFTRDRRSIHLIAGEALFEVKKDPRRPFVVATPVGCARALGTIFSVTHQLHSTSVTTQEGIVATARRDQADPNCSHNTIRLFAGQKAIVESWTPLVARTVDTAVEHAWTRQEIIFTGQTVEQALSEFNRRNWIQLDMPRDARILQMRMFGHYPLNDPERFARYLEKQLRRHSAANRDSRPK